MPETAIHPDTIAAYKATDFCVDGDVPFILHIGEPCAALANLYAKENYASCAFISPCNPFGETADSNQNESRQAAFGRMLEARGLPCREGAGRDPRGKYPPEPGFLVLGTGRDEAIALGSELRQNAIVWCGEDCIPQLILLR